MVEFVLGAVAVVGIGTAVAKHYGLTVAEAKLAAFKAEVVKAETAVGVTAEVKNLVTKLKALF